MRNQYKVLLEKYVKEIAISPEQDPRLNKLFIKKAKIQLLTAIEALIDASVLKATGEYEKADGTIGNISDVMMKIGDAKDGYELDQVWDDSQLEIYTKGLTDSFQ